MDTYPPPHTKFGVWGWGSNPDKISLSTKFKGPFNGWGSNLCEHYLHPHQ